MKLFSQKTLLNTISVASSALVISAAAYAGDGHQSKQAMDKKPHSFEHVNKTPYNMQQTHSASAEEYWQDFKQDADQSWDTAKDAFRDGWVEGKLETALMLNDQLNAFAIDIDVDNNTATLEGEVPSDVHKNLAESIAIGMQAIDSVDNNLTINREVTPDANSEGRSLTQYMKDLSITAAIKTDLLASDKVPGIAIDVTTRNQNVILTGVVDSKKEKKLAGIIARQANDVRSFENHLVVEQES